MADDGDMGRKPNPKCSKRQAAAELRRLHAVNQELLAALNWIGTVNAMDYEYQAIARAAITKGEAK
jgi:hypothetical protein